ncbi:MAG: adenylosuccinate synthetase [Candidatus Woesearchaeota archaeon]
MANIVVVGAYWGDEGKGKIVDFLSEDAEWVVRFNGGDNAGHTVVIGGKTFKIHLIPSGVFHNKKVAIGPGVLVNPETLCNEYDYLVKEGFKPKLFIDGRANVIMPYHIDIDKSREEGGRGIGSTKKGIGPCAEDAARRNTAIIIGDLVGHGFREKLIKVLELKRNELTNAVDVESIYDSYSDYGQKLKPFIIDDLAYRLSEAAKKGSVLLEGAQGTLLDLHHGTKPYQTSTDVTAQAAFSLLGIDGRIFRKIAVAKAYPSRVGGGPFPTRLGKPEQVAKEDKESGITADEIAGAKKGDEYLIGKWIRKKGHEYGTTTGRAREVGMPDFVALKYSAVINGLSSEDGWALSLVDVLGDIPLKAAIAYEKDEVKRTTFPAQLGGWKPVYEKLQGWAEMKNAAEICKKGYDALPEGVKSFCKRLVEFTGVPVEIISLGPEREMTLNNVREKTMVYLK